MTTTINSLIIKAARFATENTENHPSTFQEVLLGKYTELVIEECSRALPEGFVFGPDGRHMSIVFREHFGLE